MSMALKNAWLLIEELRKENPTMPMQVASTFLLIALHPRISGGELRKLSDQSKSAIQRNMMQLQDRYRLVVVSRDPLDSRANIAWLSPAGERLVRDIVKFTETPNGDQK